MEITTEEQQRGELSPTSLELACQRLSEIGYVIFEQVLPCSFMEEVRKAYEANESLAEGKEQRNHFLHGPFLDPRIIDNPFAWQVISESRLIAGVQLDNGSPLELRVATPKVAI